MTDRTEKTSFLLSHLLKGLLGLGLLIGAFLYAKYKIDISYIEWLAPLYSSPMLMYLVFVCSEVIFGIIPPELFMMWALSQGGITKYFLILAFLATISYAAGIIGFLFGSYLNQTRLYRWLRKKYIGKYMKYLNKYGGFVVIVAALTPLPYSAVSMLIASVDYPFKKYLLSGLFRFLRFGIYGWIIWQANTF